MKKIYPTDHVKKWIFSNFRGGGGSPTYDSVIKCVKDAQPRKETEACQVITKISPSVKVNDMIRLSSQNDLHMRV